MWHGVEGKMNMMSGLCIENVAVELVAALPHFQHGVLIEVGIVGSGRYRRVQDDNDVS